MLSNTGKPAEAEAEYRKAMAIQQKLADDNPAVTEFRSNLAMSHNNLGWLLRTRASRRRRRPSSARRWRILQKLADDNPAVTEFRSGLALSHITSAMCWSEARASRVARRRPKYRRGARRL